MSTFLRRCFLAAALTPLTASAGELEFICEHINAVLGGGSLYEHPALVQQIEAERMQQLEKEWLPLAEQNRINALPTASGDLGHQSPTIEPNDFWGSSAFGAGFSTNRPSSEYWAYAVDKWGNRLTVSVDFEFGWSAISPHERGSQSPFRIGTGEAFPVILSNRILRQTTQGFTLRHVVRLPDGATPAMIHSIVQQQTRPSHPSDGHLFMLRHYNIAETQTLERIWTCAHRLSETTSSSSVQRLMRRFLIVDIPPGAAPGLVHQGPGVPPIPESARLHPMDEIPAVATYAYSSNVRRLVRVEPLPDGRVRVTTVPYHDSEAPLVRTFSRSSFENIVLPALYQARTEIDG